MADNLLLDDLAAAVAEGSPVDWDQAEQNAKDDPERSTIRALRALARMTEVGRVTPGDALPIEPGPADALPSGEMWGHLRISELIGKGSFGNVYRAWDTRLECDVALKLMNASGVSPAFDLSRAIKEARLLARVRHKNVVRVLGADSHAGRFGLWMELVPGRSLEQVLTMHGPMGASEAMPIGMDLCHALAAVHGAGLLHRDIKAHNVVREEGGRIVLMDFGTGRPMKNGAEMSDSLAGTPLYLAPELFSGENPTAASDIYSLGVLLYHLVTNDYPVRGNSRHDVESAHQQATRRPLRDARPDLPAPFIDVVERALSRDPSNRYRSAGEFGNALASIGGVTTSTPEEMPHPRWRTSHLAALVAAIIVVLVGASLLNRRAADVSDSVTTGQTRSGQPPADNAVANAPTAQDASYEVMASLYASRDGQDVRLTHGSQVRPGDKLFAVVNASKPVFVYIINRDDSGESFLLFPLPSVTPGNPIPNKQTIRLPGTMDGQQHYWQVTSVGGQEHFFLYVTPNRLFDFEQLLAALPRAEVGRSVSSVRLPTSAMNELRGVGGLSAITSSPTASAGAELTELQPLADRSETAAGVWARRISFQNPAK